MPSSKRFTAGTPLGALRDADWLNYVTSGAEAAHHSRFGQSPSYGAGGRTTVQVRNESGQDLLRFGVLGITGVIVTPGMSLQTFQSDFPLRGGAPDEERDSAGRVLITSEPIRSGLIGTAVLLGPTPVRLNLLDGEQYTAAKIVTDDVTKLEADDDGDIPVLYHEQGPGLKWALVNLGAGGGGSCPEVHQLWIEGSPTSGSVEWDYTIKDVEETLEFTYNMTAAQMQAEFETHSQVAADEVECIGGPFPHVAIEATFKVDVAYPPTAISDTLEAEEGDPVFPAMKLRRSSGS